jgi:hypothetical protein
VVQSVVFMEWGMVGFPKKPRRDRGLAGWVGVVSKA